MNWEWEGTVHENCVVFCKVGEQWGGLSNMNNDFPLRVNGPDWEQVQEAVMRWCLRVKLAQHVTKFGGLLRGSAPRPIVERSRKDRFWGGVLEADGVLRGENRLGRLLMELREELLACKLAGQ